MLLENGVANITLKQVDIWPKMSGFLIKIMMLGTI